MITQRAATICLLLLLSQSLSACTPLSTGQDTGPGPGQGPRVRGVAVHEELSGGAVLGEVPPGVVQGALGIGFVRPEHRDVPPFERPQTEEFHLLPDEPFAPFLILLNNSSDSEVFLVTVLLDYRQVAFQLDGQEAVLHEVSVPALTELELPMRVESMEPGSHDLQVLAFEDPYNLTMDVDHRQMWGFGQVYGRRAVLVVGGVAAPARDPDSLATGMPLQASVIPGAPSVSLVRAPSEAETAHPSQRRLYVDVASRGCAYPFEILAANETDTAASFGIVAFLDYHQVSLDGQELLAAHLGPGEEVTLSEELVMPQEPGVHQLQVVWLLDPYHSVVRDEAASPFVYASARVAIDVQ